MARYKVVYDTDHTCDAIEVSSVEHGLDLCVQIFWDWEMDELRGMELDTEKWEYHPTREQIEKWDYMIDSCSVWVEDTETNSEYYPSDEDLDRIGWNYWEDRK